MKKKWTDFLTEDVYKRLANCNSVKSDIPKLVNAKWREYKEIGKDKCGFTKEDALIYVLELLERILSSSFKGQISKNRILYFYTSIRNFYFLTFKF